MAREKLSTAQRQQIVKARLANKPVRAVAADLNVSPTTVQTVWKSPENFAVVAAERAKRAGLIGKVLDAVFGSLIKDLEAPTGDKMALRVHALDIVGRGELPLERVMPGLVGPVGGDPAATPGGQAGGLSLQELLLISVKQATTNGNGHNGNGHGPEPS